MFLQQPTIVARVLALLWFSVCKGLWISCTDGIAVYWIFYITTTVLIKGRYGTYNGNFFHIHPRVVIFGYDMYLWKTSNFSMGHFLEQPTVAMVTVSLATKKAENNAIL